MAEDVSLELLFARVNESLEGQRNIAIILNGLDMRLERIETAVTEIETDMRSLARVMLRLESRVHALEQTE